MIAVISDIHSNYPALRAVIKEIDRYKVDSIICLGDIAGYYCFINECIDLCREKNISNILGNHDYYLISRTGCPRSYSANVCLQYQLSVITDENYIWLKKSIPFFDNEEYSFRHGGWKDPLDEYLYNFSFECVKGLKQHIFASGHTHKQILKKATGKTYFNPGSVGQPRDYDSRAAFALIKDDGSVELKRCEYPIEETINCMRKLGFDDRISDCLRYGGKIGEKQLR